MYTPHAEYLKTRVLTATPGELVVMLYDALFQRIRQASMALEEGAPARVGELLGNAQDILTELMSALRPEHAPELSQNLFELYVFSKRRLLEGFAARDAAILNEVVAVLTPLRDGFAEAERALRSQRPE